MKWLGGYMYLTNCTICTLKILLYVQLCVANNILVHIAQILPKAIYNTMILQIVMKKARTIMKAITFKGTQS